MGSPLRGRGLLVLDRNEGLVSPFGSGTLVSSWLAIPLLSAGVCAPCQGVLPGGPQCVLTVGLPLALSRVLLGPLLGVWDVFRPLPSFLPAGVGASVGCSALRSDAACALSLLCAPLAVGLLPGSPNRLCPVSADCRLGLEPSLRVWLPPLTVGSPSALGLPVSLLFPPWGCESARVLPSLLGPSPSGVCTFFSRLFLCWRPCRSRSLIPSLAPSWW